MGGEMVRDDGGARLVLAQAGDQNPLQRRLNTGQSVAAATVMTASIPPRASAPSTVRRRQ